MNSTDSEVYVEYGKTQGNYNLCTDISSLQKNQPAEIIITGLQKDAQYYYRIDHRAIDDINYSAGNEGSFHTQRAAGAGFVFTVDADPHFDTNSDNKKN
jgi:hypothetical protein